MPGGARIAFVARDGFIQVRRGLHWSPLRAGAGVVRWGHAHADATTAARAMLVSALEDGEPTAELVQAFASEVVMALPRDTFELTDTDVLAWVTGLGTSQKQDLREEQRARRLNTLPAYAGQRVDPAQQPVDEAGGGVAEGFEAAEAALVAHATHAERGGDPGRDAFTAEVEADEAGSVYGEADDAQPGGTP